MEDRRTDKPRRRRASTRGNGKASPPPASRPRRKRKPASVDKPALRVAPEPTRPPRTIERPAERPTTERRTEHPMERLPERLEERLNEGLGERPGERRSRLDRLAAATRGRPVLALIVAGGTAAMLGVELLASALWGGAATLAWGRPARPPLRTRIAHRGFALYDRVRDRLGLDEAAHLPG